MRLLLPALLATACGTSGSPATDDAAALDGAGRDAGDADATARGCPAGKAGAACILALADAAAAGCAPAAVETLRAELDARRALGTLWAT